MPGQQALPQKLITEMGKALSIDLNSLSTLEEGETIVNGEDQPRSSVMQGPPILKRRIQDIEVYIHASNLHKVMTGQFGLTDRQEADLLELEDRYKDPDGKPLTDIIKEKMTDLIMRKANPDIGQTGKTYLDEIVTEALYEIPKYLHTKYTHHGQVSEQHSIDMLNAHLGAAFKKNTIRKTDKKLLLTGEPDIVGKDYIIDIKNPYDTYTFDRHRNTETFDQSGSDMQQEYYWQGQAYMHLFRKPNFYLIYTLNENMYMEDQEEYIRFGFLDRIIIKKMNRDYDAMKKYRQRLLGITNAIKGAKQRRLQSMKHTASLLKELKV